jgi:hypothetical protein
MRVCIVRTDRLPVVRVTRAGCPRCHREWGEEGWRNDLNEEAMGSDDDDDETEVEES